MTGTVLIVTRRTSKLLQEIEEGAVDGKTPIADVLRRVIALGGQAGSAEMRDWATRELRGYATTDEVPAYRVVGAPILLDATLPFGGSVRGQQVSSLELPDFARDDFTEEVSLRAGIGELEQVAARATPGEPIRLQPGGGAELAMYMNGQGNTSGHIERIYWAVSATAIQGVVDNVRTTLAVMVAEINATQPDGDLTSDTATNAVHLAVSGKRPVINLANAQSGSTASVATPGDGGINWWTVTLTILGVLVAIAAGVFALMQAQGWKFR